MSLADTASLVDIILKILQCVAIVVGGIWTYSLFIRKREKYPRATISHEIVHKGISEQFSFIHVIIHIENKGDVLIKLVDGEVRLLQVLPFIGQLEKEVIQGKDPVGQSATEINWYEISGRNFEEDKTPTEIEPGECEFFYADFVIEKGIQTVQIYSFFRNEAKLKNKGKPDEKELGWSCTTLYDLEKKEKNKHAKQKHK